MGIIKENDRYRGEMINEWNESHKNCFVMTGMQMSDKSYDNYIGKVVQVRLEAGDFGSDNVLLRHVDGRLSQHTNQSFWLVPDEFTGYFSDLFDKHLRDEDGNIFIDDADEYEYNLGGGSEPKKGFIIPSEIKESESTPMRNIKTAIKKKLSEL